MTKLAVTGLLAVSAVTRVIATAFGPGTDMATLNDYSYYVTNPDEGRAVLKWSADKKRLYLRRRRGLLFVVR